MGPPAPASWKFKPRGVPCWGSSILSEDALGVGPCEGAWGVPGSGQALRGWTLPGGTAGVRDEGLVTRGRRHEAEGREAGTRRELGPCGLRSPGAACARGSQGPAEGTRSAGLTAAASLSPQAACRAGSGPRVLLRRDLSAPPAPPRPTAASSLSAPLPRTALLPPSTAAVTGGAASIKAPASGHLCGCGGDCVWGGGTGRGSADRAVGPGREQEPAASKVPLGGLCPASVTGDLHRTPSAPMRSSPQP